MIKSLLLLFTMHVVLGTSAQQIKTSLSPEIDMERDITAMQRYGKKICAAKINWKTEPGFGANLKVIAYGIELIQYDEHLQKVKRLSIDNDKRNLGPFQPMISFSKEKIFVMYFNFEGADLKVYVAKIDPESLVIEDTKTVMGYQEKHYRNLLSFTKIYGNSRTYFTVSEDGSKAWIVHATPKQILNCVIDANLNLVHPAETLPITLENFSINDVHLENDGRRVMTYEYYDPAYKWVVAKGLFFQNPGEPPAYIPMAATDGKYPGTQTLSLSDDGKQLYMGGEYFQNESSRTGAGVQLASINIWTRSYSTPVFYPYSDDLKQRMLDLHFAWKEKGSIFFAERLKYRINEMNDETVVMSSDIHVTYKTEKYTKHYTGPVLHFFIKPGGKSNFALIPKRQPNSVFTEYMNIFAKDKMICVYADHPKNHEKVVADKDIKLLDEIKELVPVANTYDADGNLLSRKLLISSGKEIRGNVMIGFGTRVKDDHYLFPIGRFTYNFVRYYSTTVDHLWDLEVTID